MTYHYFNYGVMPGSIVLIHSDGSVYGPWQAMGRPGQGGVPNAQWEVMPNAEIKAGTYIIVDSDFKTWSRNQESASKGHALIRGYPAGTQVKPPQTSPGPNYYVDLGGEWDLVGNGFAGTMTISNQQGPRFSGMVYSEKLIDGQISGGKISFIRKWDSGFQQEFYGTLTIDLAGKATMEGTFTQNGGGSYVWTATKKNRVSQPGVPQAPGIPDVSGNWDIVGNGHVGTMSISSQQGARFSGMVYTEKLVDGQIAGGKISFIRKWDSGFQQEFYGTLTVDSQGKATMEGTFTQNGGGSYVWTATRRKGF